MGTSSRKKTAKKVQELLEQNSEQPIPNRIRIASSKIDLSNYFGSVAGVGGIVGQCAAVVSDASRGDYSKLPIKDKPEDEFEAQSVAAELISSLFEDEPNELIEAALTVAMVDGLLGENQSEKDFTSAFCREFIERILRAELFEGALEQDSSEDNVDTLTPELNKAFKDFAHDIVTSQECVELIREFVDDTIETQVFMSRFEELVKDIMEQEEG